MAPVTENNMVMKKHLRTKFIDEIDYKKKELFEESKKKQEQIKDQVFDMAYLECETYRKRITRDAKILRKTLQSSEHFASFYNKALQKKASYKNKIETIVADDLHNYNIFLDIVKTPLEIPEKSLI